MRAKSIVDCIEPQVVSKEAYHRRWLIPVIAALGASSKNTRVGGVIDALHAWVGSSCHKRTGCVVWSC